MQVNILRDFTEITMHVLQGQHTLKKKKEKEKSRAFSACVNVSFSRPPPAI